MATAPSADQSLAINGTSSPSTGPPTPIKASVLHGPHDLRLETQSLPAPGPDELRIAIHTTTLCGSDLHYYNHFRNGDIIVREPLTLGHESSGIVTAPIPPNSPFKEGDRVALEPGIPCQQKTICRYCCSGERERYNICPNLRFRSSAKSVPHYQGLLATHVNHPAKYVHRLPDGVTLAEGALLEPLGVALHAWRRSGLSSASPGTPASNDHRGGSGTNGLKVLVFGAGAVGALCAGVARMKGATTVVIADIDPGRVAFAVEKGFADHGVVVSSKRAASTEEGLKLARATADQIARTMVGKDDEQAEFGFADAVFECTGVQTCVQAAIYATAPGGRVMLVGMGQPIQTLQLSAAALREVDLVGVFRYADTWPESIALLSSSKETATTDGVSKSRSRSPDFGALITHTVRGLDGVDEAFRIAGRTVDDHGALVVKVAVESS